MSQPARSYSRRCGVDEETPPPSATGRERAAAPAGARQNGFSLLELMAAIAVAALLLSVGVPSFSTTVKNANMVSSANSFLGDLRYARDLAVTLNRRVVMCPTSNGAACDTGEWTDGWIVFVDEDNDQSVDAGEPIQRVTEGLSRLSLDSNQFSDAITYRPSGRAMGETVSEYFGAFLMCDDRGSGHARGIVVDYSGHPRVTHLAKIGVNPTCPAI